MQGGSITPLNRGQFEVTEGLPPPLHSCRGGQGVSWNQDAEPCPMSKW